MKKHCILLADDDASIRELLSRALASENFEVVLARPAGPTWCCST